MNKNVFIAPFTLIILLVIIPFGSSICTGNYNEIERIVIVNDGPNTLDSGQTIYVVLNGTTYSNYDTITIYNENTCTEINTDISFYSPSLKQIGFALQQPLLGGTISDGDYNIYHENNTFVSPPRNPALVYLDYENFDSYSFGQQLVDTVPWDYGDLSYGTNDPKHFNITNEQVLWGNYSVYIGHVSSPVDVDIVRNFTRDITTPITISYFVYPITPYKSRAAFVLYENTTQNHAMVYQSEILDPAGVNAYYRDYYSGGWNTEFYLTHGSWNRIDAHITLNDINISHNTVPYISASYSHTPVQSIDALGLHHLAISGSIGGLYLDEIHVTNTTMPPPRVFTYEDNNIMYFFTQNKPSNITIIQGQDVETTTKTVFNSTVTQEQTVYVDSDYNTLQKWDFAYTGNIYNEHLYLLDDSVIDKQQRMQISDGITNIQNAEILAHQYINGSWHLVYATYSRPYQGEYYNALLNLDTSNHVRFTVYKSGYGTISETRTLSPVSDDVISIELVPETTSGIRYITTNTCGTYVSGNTTCHLGIQEVSENTTLRINYTVGGTSTISTTTGTSLIVTNVPINTINNTIHTQYYVDEELVHIMLTTLTERPAIINVTLDDLPVSSTNMQFTGLILLLLAVIIGGALDGHIEGSGFYGFCGILIAASSLIPGLQSVLIVGGAFVIARVARSMLT